MKVSCFTLTSPACGPRNSSSNFTSDVCSFSSSSTSSTIVAATFGAVVLSVSSDSRTLGGEPSCSDSNFTSDFTTLHFLRRFARLDFTLASSTSTTLVVSGSFSKASFVPSDDTSLTSTSGIRSTQVFSFTTEGVGILGVTTGSFHLTNVLRFTVELTDGCTSSAIPLNATRFNSNLAHNFRSFGLSMLTSRGSLERFLVPVGSPVPSTRSEDAAATASFRPAVTPNDLSITGNIGFLPN